jgi:beta-glucosidase
MKPGNPGMVLRFPPNFLWGVATSPTQVEGHISNEWTNFVARDGGTCRVACDNYHRYPEDIEWMTRLGINACRVGIEWSRLQSRPYAPLDQAELDRYCDLLDRLQTAGIVPMVVLHHFSNPPWISSDGGWINPATIPAFVDYVTKLVSALRGRVRLWNTFNEPDTYASCTYLLGEFPPFLKWRLKSFRAVIRHMAEAHLKVCRVIREQGGGQGQIEVGFSKNWTFFQPFRKTSPWDRCIAAISHAAFNRFVLDQFLGGDRKGSSTFLGLNYYGRVRFKNCRPLAPVGGLSRKTLAQIGVDCDDMFERHPPGMELAVRQLYEQHRLPIYVTEHGAASTDENFRERDLRQNLAALHRAMGSGAKVRGFFYWSLLDNFEWQFGYSKKFGLIEVDFKDEKLPRKMKALGHVYHQICRGNSI